MKIAQVEKRNHSQDTEHDAVDQGDVKKRKASDTGVFWGHGTSIF